MTHATLASIFVYPIKSARGHQRMTAEVRTLGLRWDRRWMVVDGEGRFLTQREIPGLAQIAVECSVGGLILRHHHLPPLAVPRIRYPALHDVRVWDRVVRAVDQGDEPASWLSAALKYQVRLVSLPPEMENRTGRHRTAFADSRALLVVCEASLDALNARLAEQGHASVGMDRFRPNLVLRGLPAFGSDGIASLRIGDLELRMDKPCTRCRIVCTDQETGEVGVEPLRTLGELRNGAAGSGITFGWYAEPVAGADAKISVGSRVEVIPQDEEHTRPAVPAVAPRRAPIL